MPEPEDIAPEDVETDAILVTDADSATGEQIVLQLILARHELTAHTNAPAPKLCSPCGAN